MLRGTHICVPYNLPEGSQGRLYRPFSGHAQGGVPSPRRGGLRGRPPYRLPYSRCSFITASTSGGSTSGHCPRGIFPLRMSLDAQG